MRTQHLSSSAIAMAVALLGAPASMAATPTLPTGGTFAAGSGSIATSGSAEAVSIASKPSSGPVVINWGGYSVGAGGSVSYAPGSGGPTSGTVVNVDNSGSASVINGAISSPNYSQVIVNPNGISVGATASLPSSTELAAGTFKAATSTSPVSITADAAPITIAPGATFGPAPAAAQTPSGIGVTAVSGDTLPDSAGMRPVPVTVPAGKASSFTLQPGQTGAINFIGPLSSSYAVTAPSSVTITGPAGATIGNLSLSEPVQLPTLPTGTMSVSNVTSTGSLSFESGQGLSLSGTVSATGNLDAMALAYGQPGPGLAPGSSAGAVLTIAPGTTINSGGYATLEGNTVTMSGAVKSDAPYLSILSNQAMQLASTADASVTDAAAGSVITLQAPSISNLSISGAGTAAIGANAQSGISVSAPRVTLEPASYESGSPDYKPLTADNVSVSTGNLQIDGAYGVTLNNVHQTLLAGDKYAFVTIDGANSVGGYPTSTNAANKVSISNSSFDAGSGGIMEVNAGVESATTRPGAIPGDISISGSTMAAAHGRVMLNAYDGGSISVDSSSDLTVNEAGACDATGVACRTAISAGTVNFQPGNSETANGKNLIAATTVTGTANATPAEVAVSSGSAVGGVQLYALDGGSVSVAGKLDAGTPPAPAPTTTTTTAASTTTTTAAAAPVQTQTSTVAPASTSSTSTQQSQVSTSGTPTTTALVASVSTAQSTAPVIDASASTAAAASAPTASAPVSVGSTTSTSGSSTTSSGTTRRKS